MFPNNADLEKSVLGCLLSGKIDRIIELSEADFHNEANRLVFNAMSQLYERKQEVDEISVSNLARLDNALEYVNNLQHYVGSSENISYYMENLQLYTMRREVLKRIEKARAMALDGYYDNSICLKNDIQQALDIKVKCGDNGNHKIAAIMDRVTDDIEKRYNAKHENKLFSGFFDLDKITAGLHSQELTLIAARPGVGKTAMAIQIMLNLARKGNYCLFVSREMSDVQIGKRILANVSEIDGQKLRFCKSLNSEEFQKIMHTSIAVSELPIEINANLATVQEIRAYCRELKVKNQLDILIVDYLQLCKSIKKTESRRQEIEDISRQLKEMSMEFDMPVIALSQLSRESVSSGEPELHHLRESGSLEQDSDNVIFLHVPKDTDEHAAQFDIKVIVGKQRNGPTGYIMLRYHRRTFKLCNLA